MKRRMTKQRFTILETLRNRCDHPTAESLFLSLKRQLPKISLGTVYRNLDVLVQMELIRVISVAGGPKRFDGNLDTHDHFHCCHCGRVIDLPSGTLPDDKSINLKGFVVINHTFELEGICEKCTKPS